MTNHIRLTETHMQCAGCLRYFSGMGAFDAHRATHPQDQVAPRPHSPRRICLDPMEVGLEWRGGWWRKPITEAQREAFDRMTTKETES